MVSEFGAALRALSHRRRTQRRTQTGPGLGPWGQGDLLPLDPEDRVRDLAHDVATVLQAGVGSFEELLAVLADRRAAAGVRSAACHVLGHLGDDRAVPGLAAVLHRGRGRLCRSALEGLRQHGSRAAGQALLAFVQSGAAAVLRANAVAVLLELGDRDAAGPLARRLLDPQEDPRVRLNAIYALGWLGGGAQAQALLTVLEHDADPVLRSAAAHALRGLGGEQALGPLTATLTDPDEDQRVREEAAETLETLRRLGGWSRA